MRAKRRKIQRLVETLLQLAKIEVPPVDVEKIATLRGAEVRHGFFEGEAEIAGVLFREGSQIVIGVNKSHPRTRQRFTIAHELGHLELHGRSGFHVDRKFPASVRLRNELSSQAVDPDEIQANAFAAELLMPTSMLEQDIRDLISNQVFDYESGIDHLARNYEVSVQAMTFRLINLGFIQG